MIRQEIFKAVSKSDLKGLNFTYVWVFDQKEDWDFVENACTIFESSGGNVYFVELEANLKDRLKRNRTPNRLEHKPSKRNIEHSESELKKSMGIYRLNSFKGDIQRQNYIKINNEKLTAEEAAKMIQKRFQL